MEAAIMIFTIYAMLAPLATGHYAATHGRSFWVWFLISLLLPAISVFILLALPDLSPEAIEKRRLKALADQQRKAA